MDTYVKAQLINIFENVKQWRHGNESANEQLLQKTLEKSKLAIHESISSHFIIQT